MNEIIIKADGGAHLFALSGKTGQGVSSNSTAFSSIGDKVNTKKKWIGSRENLWGMMPIDLVDDVWCFYDNFQCQSANVFE